VAVEATMVYPTDPGPSVALIPPHLATAVRNLVEQDGFR